MKHCDNCGSQGIEVIAGRSLCSSCRALLVSRGYLLPPPRESAQKGKPIWWIVGGHWENTMVSENYLVGHRPEEIRWDLRVKRKSPGC